MLPILQFATANSNGWRKNLVPIILIIFWYIFTLKCGCKNVASLTGFQ